MNHNEMSDKITCYVKEVFDQQYQLRQFRTDSVKLKLEKVLDAFSSEKLGTHHFFSETGYAHNDLAREVIDRVYAKVLGAERAAVRMQFVSGTHAIAAALFGVLRPGDRLLSVTGRPYETLEEVIGLRGRGKGSLNEFGVAYEEVNVFRDNSIDFAPLRKSFSKQVKMVFIQRSCGYSWRPSLSIEEIEKICFLVHKQHPECVCFVDNCYGEFVEYKEPTEVGADLMAGSLIKNPGGTIVPTGGYVAGRSDLVEKTCYRLTAPGIGAESGSTFNLNRLVLQGLFLSPQMVAEALIGADLICGVFQKLGYEVQPRFGQHRGDIIQAVNLREEKVLKTVIRSFQESSPIGSYLDPFPAPMPGYQNELIMAGGTFIDGSTSEFSADAPLKPPYNLFSQGGTHHSHILIALERALYKLLKAGLLNLPQTGL